MNWLLPNIPLCVLFFALWVGVPLWMVLKHPDTKPAPAARPAPTRLPQPHRPDDDQRRAA